MCGFVCVRVRVLACERQDILFTRPRSRSSNVPRISNNFRYRLQKDSNACIKKDEIEYCYHLRDIEASEGEIISICLGTDGDILNHDNIMRFHWIVTTSFPEIGAMWTLPHVA